MAFLIAPPNTGGINDTGTALANLYTTLPGEPGITFRATPEDGGVAPTPAGGGESSYAYVA